MAKRIMLQVLDTNKGKYVRKEESSEQVDIMVMISNVVKDDKFILQDIEKMETVLSIIYTVTGKYK
ncbi:TPA: hypothetical protein QC364_000784 [Bacillus cereus]|nr:hypothetical protein [Bacillus cereus]